MKDKFMMIRATEEEKALANTKAKELGMSLSFFIRHLVRQWGETSQDKREGLLGRLSNWLAIRLARLPFFRG